MKLSLLRRSATGLALAVTTTVLAQPLLVPAATAATDLPAPAPARAGTGWLATQLTDGLIYNPNFGGFNDYGLTLDIGVSMDEVGGDQALVRQIRQAMSSRIASYVSDVDYGAPENRYSGSLAKSLVFAQATGADPRSYGGFDLVQEVEARVIASGPSAGRLGDSVGGADYANSFGQALAARGLSVAGSPQAGAVTDFLLQQQCSEGFFRIFFNTDRDATAQGCVDGVDGTDTDTTAIVVAQLAAIPSPSPRVEAAIDRATDWLVTTQNADGSFVGSAFTPDPNTNSTGLAASALAADGRCVQAGRAAEWVESLQVGAQPAGSPLSGEEGALAYSADAMAAAVADGITDATRDQWWRASVQAVAGLTHYRGSASALTVTSTGTEPGKAATLSATGANVGERFCLSGPGITGSRTVVVGTDGTLEAPVTLPTALGEATYTLTGRDGAATHTVAVRPANAPSSIAGVRLTAPSGFREAGTKVTLDVLGAPAGARFVLRGPGVDATVTAASDGVLTRTVTLPASTTTASYMLVGTGGQVGAAVKVLGRTRLKVSSSKSDRPRKRVVVRGLAAGEKVRLLVAGKTLAKGRADDKGRFVVKVEVAKILKLTKKRTKKVKVRALGQFPALRSGTTKITLR